MSRYVLHATARKVIKNKHTGRTENLVSRPTIVVEASSESAALNKAKKQEAAKWKNSDFELINLSLVSELTRKIS